MKGILQAEHAPRHEAELFLKILANLLQSPALFEIHLRYYRAVLLPFFTSVGLSSTPRYPTFTIRGRGHSWWFAITCRSSTNASGDTIR
jgi:hypothetical protein